MASENKTKTANRRQEVKDFMENVGPFSVPVVVLAEKWGCHERTIRRDIVYWLKKLDFKDLDIEGRRLVMMLRNNLAIAEELAAKGKPMDRLRAIQVTNQTAEQLTKIMENYGFKEKVEEKQRIEIVSKLSDEEKDAEIKRLLGR